MTSFTSPHVEHKRRVIVVLVPIDLHCNMGKNGWSILQNLWFTWHAGRHVPFLLQRSIFMHYIWYSFQIRYSFQIS